MMIWDALAVNGAYGIVLLLRHEGFLRYIDVAYVHTYKWLMIPYAVIAVLIFLLFGMYRSIWKYAGFSELFRAFLGSSAASLIYSVMCTLLICTAFKNYSRMPLTFYVFGYAVQLLAVTGVRIIWRFLYFAKKRKMARNKDTEKVLLAGAGDNGAFLLNALALSENSGDRVVAAVDDDPSKHGRYIGAVKVIGGREMIPSAVNKMGIGKIIVAMPGAADEDRHAILEICGDTNCKIIDLTDIYNDLTGKDIQ